MTASDASFDRYVADIRRTTRIGDKEEMELLEKAQGGSLEARNKLILAHMRFVLKVALHYRKGPVPVADLISEGVLGLVRAVDSYERTGIKFLSYAVWWMRSYMVRAIEDKGAVIRLPANEHARLRREKKAARREPGEKREEATWVRTVSTQRPNGLEAWEEFADPAPGPETRLMEDRLDREVRERIESLPDNQSLVIRSIYGIRRQEADTLQEIAWDLGVSPERVRQLREKALKRLRNEDRPMSGSADWL